MHKIRINVINFDITHKLQFFIINHILFFNLFEIFQKHFDFIFLSLLYLHLFNVL